MSTRYLPGQPHQLPRHNQPMAGYQQRTLGIPLILGVHHAATPTRNCSPPRSAAETIESLNK